MTLPPPFSVQIQASGDCARVIVRGELDIASVPELERAVERLTDGGQVRRLTLDLREAQLMDSTGLGFLLRCKQAKRRDGLTLLIVRGSDAVQRMLRVTGLEDHFDFIDASEPINPP
jgi:anti-sigma B factor antagonist